MEISREKREELLEKKRDELFKKAMKMLEDWEDQKLDVDIIESMLIGCKWLTERSLLLNEVIKEENFKREELEELLIEIENETIQKVEKFSKIHFNTLNYKLESYKALLYALHLNDSYMQANVYKEYIERNQK